MVSQGYSIQGSRRVGGAGAFLRDRKPGRGAGCRKFRKNTGGARTPGGAEVGLRPHTQEGEACQTGTHEQPGCRRGPQRKPYRRDPPAAPRLRLQGAPPGFRRTHNDSARPGGGGRSTSAGSRCGSSRMSDFFCSSCAFRASCVVPFGAAGLG